MVASTIFITHVASTSMPEAMHVNERGVDAC
jgi:hypothetical protein